MELREAGKLCAAFSRSMNYPKDTDQLEALARGLMRAEQITGVPGQRIVEECLQTSMYCPTDADLLSVARGIRGPAAPGIVASAQKRCTVGQCDGSGWISKRVHADPLRDGKGYDTWAAQRCECHPPREPESAARKSKTPKAPKPSYYESMENR